jgi:hypothetical protein
MVANEFIKNGLFDLEWVVRRTHKENHKYAIRLLGYELNDAPIFSVAEVSPVFFQQYPVELIFQVLEHITNMPPPLIMELKLFPPFQNTKKKIWKN